MPESGYQLIPREHVLEEERYSYSQQTYYPVRIGEVFNSRYQAIGKLGFGSYSTVWLCRDLQAHEYVALKVYEVNKGAKEKEIYDRLDTVARRSRHAGSAYVRTSLDSFFIVGPTGGHHLCISHQPMGMNMNELRRAFGGRLPKSIFKIVMINILLAVDFLHTEARVIHTDIQPNNILIKIDDDAVFAKFEADEKAHPSPRKINGNRITYMSRQLSQPDTYGLPALVDFGEARMGASSYNALIQPFPYRAPEVILGMNWTEKAEIWNVAMMAWDLFENKHIFDGRDASGKESNAHMLAEMCAIIGLPPSAFLRQSPTRAQYFDDRDRPKVAPNVMPLPLERAEANLRDDDKAQFLKFMRKMLHWVPEERYSAKELLEDPWLNNYDSDSD